MPNISYIILIIDSLVTGHDATNYNYIIFSIFFYLISSQVHLCLHEIGHFIGGYLTGYKLLYLHILIFGVEKQRIGNYRFSINKFIEGKCVMIPCMNTNGEIPYLWYNSGGLIVNLMFGVISLILSFIYSGLLSNFFLQMAFAGFFKFSVNIIPDKKHNLTDGYVLITLYKNPNVRSDYYKYLHLFAKYYLNEKIQLSDYTYARESRDKTDELIFYLEIKKILQLSKRKGATNGK